MPSRPLPAASTARALPLSDISVGGDPLALAHLAPPRREHPATVAEFAGLARSIAADRGRWAPLVRYDPVSRWYHRLDTGPGYEVWLLSWLPGQGTGRHDHGRSFGVFTVLDGALTEHSPPAASGLPAHSPAGHRPSERGPNRRGESTGVLRPGVERVVAPGHVHEVVNDTLEPAVSLHVYFPGLTEMTSHPRPLRTYCPTSAAPSTGARGAPARRAR